jgi:hypothetical protein
MTWIECCASLEDPALGVARELVQPIVEVAEVVAVQQGSPIPGAAGTEEPFG